MNTLSVSNLNKAYKQKNVVRDVSLKVSRGEVVGLLGPNGAGKTTSFYMIVGLIPVDKGTITIDQTDITNAPMHKRGQLGLGYLAQEPSIFKGLSVADNVLAILETRKELSLNERNNICEDLLHDLSRVSECTLRGAINAVTPSISAMFVIFEPRALPIANSGFP